MLTGLARKVEEGYQHYWKHIIDNHDVDFYLHCWEDEEYEKVKEVYPNPKYIYIQKPFKFTKYKEGIESPNDDKSRPNILIFLIQYSHHSQVLRTGLPPVKRQ